MKKFCRNTWLFAKSIPIGIVSLLVKTALCCGRNMKRGSFGAYIWTAIIGLFLMLMFCPTGLFAVNISPLKVDGATITNTNPADSIFKMRTPTGTGFWITTINDSGYFSHDSATWYPFGTGSGGGGGADADTIRGIKVSEATPSNTQVLKYSSDSSIIYWGTDATGGAGAAIVVEDDGVVELSATDTISFTGGIDLSNSGDGQVDVTINVGDGIEIYIDSTLGIDTSAMMGMVKDSGIDSSYIIDGTITSEDIENGTIIGLDIATGTIQSSDILDNTITTDDIGTGGVGADEIATNGVGAAEIAANAVGQSEIASGGVASSEIEDNSIAQSDIGTGAVGTDEILNGNIALIDMASNSVDSSKIVDYSISSTDIALAAIGSGQIANDAIATSYIQDGAVTEPKLYMSNDTADGYVIGWNGTTARLQWISNAAGAETDPTLTDDGAVTIGDNTTADPVLTFDGSAGTDGTITWDESEDVHLFNGGIKAGDALVANSNLLLDNDSDEDGYIFFHGASEAIQHSRLTNLFTFSDSILSTGNIRSAANIVGVDGIFSGDVTVTDDIFADSGDTRTLYSDTVKTPLFIIGNDTITDITGSNLTNVAGALTAATGGGGYWDQSDSNLTYYANDTALEILPYGDTTIVTAAENSILVLRETSIILDGGADTTTLSGQSRGDTVTVADHLEIDGSVQMGGYKATTADGSDGWVWTYDATGDSSYWAAVSGSGSGDSLTFNESNSSSGTEYSILNNLIKIRPGTGLTITREDSTSFDLFRFATTLGTSIDSTELTALSVDSAELINGSVHTNKIADNAVTAAKIIADAVGSSEIAANAVGTSEIATGGVGADEIATGAVTTTEILDQTIGTADIDTSYEGVIWQQLTCNQDLRLNHNKDNVLDGGDCGIYFGDDDGTYNAYFLYDMGDEDFTLYGKAAADVRLNVPGEIVTDTIIINSEPIKDASGILLTVTAGDLNVDSATIFGRISDSLDLALRIADTNAYTLLTLLSADTAMGESLGVYYDTAATVDTIQALLTDYLPLAGGDVDSIDVDTLIVSASLELPNAANPTTDAEGEIAWDSDDDFIEVYSGNETESAIIPIYDCFQGTLFNPDGLTDSLPVYDVGNLQWPGGIEIDSIQVTTSVDGAYALGFIAYSNADPPVLGEWIDTLNVGASDQKANSVLFTDAAIEVGKTIYVSIPATDIDWVKFSVWFHGLGVD